MSKVKYKYRVRHKTTGKYLGNGKGTTTWSSSNWAIARITEKWANRNPADYVLEKIEMVVVEEIEVGTIIQEKVDKEVAARVKEQRVEAERTRIRVHIQELCNCTVDQARTIVKTGIIVEPINSRLKVLLKEFDNPKIDWYVKKE